MLKNLIPKQRKRFHHNFSRKNQKKNFPSQRQCVKEILTGIIGSQKFSNRIFTRILGDSIKKQSLSCRIVVVGRSYFIVEQTQTTYMHFLYFPNTGTTLSGIALVLENPQRSPSQARCQFANLHTTRLPAANTYSSSSWLSDIAANDVSAGISSSSSLLQDEQ